MQRIPEPNFHMMAPARAVTETRVRTGMERKPRRPVSRPSSVPAMATDARTHAWSVHVAAEAGVPAAACHMAKK